MSHNDEVPDFGGKCVSMLLMDDKENHDLWNPRFEMQGGRLFIVGAVPVGATESNWVAGCISSVAWDRVVEYYIFESIDAYSSAISTSERFRKRETEDFEDGEM